MQHWFQHILFVSLGPGADWQLSDFYSFVVNNFHITLHKELVSINLGNGTSEVLVRGYLQVEGGKNAKISKLLPLHFIQKISSLTPTPAQTSPKEH